MGYGLRVRQCYRATSLDEIKAMLKIARDNNIYHLDTAQCYGDSEKILGLCNVMKSGFKVSTKLKLENSSFTKDYIARMCEKSLSNLKSDHLNGLMIHNSENFWASFEIHMGTNGIIEKER